MTALATVVVAGFFSFVAPVVELAVAVAGWLPRFPVAAVRVDRAFSAQLLKRLVALICLTGELERPGTSSGGGRGLPMIALAFGVARGRGHMLADDGDRALRFLAIPASCFKLGLLRTFFLATTVSSDFSSLVFVEFWSLLSLLVYWSHNLRSAGP